VWNWLKKWFFVKKLGKERISSRGKNGEQ